MSDLAGFLAARLDEDEVIAQGAARTDDGLGGNWVPAAIAGKWLSADARVDDHVAAHDPARVLREVKAKRKIIAEHWPQAGHPEKCRRCITDRAGYPEEWSDDTYPCLTLRLTAAAYSDHPDYDPAWSAE